MLISMKMVELEITRDGLYVGIGRDRGRGRGTAAFFDFTGNGLWAIDWRGRQVAGVGMEPTAAGRAAG